MKKPHITPIAWDFIKTAQNGVEYTDDRNYIQFEGNTVSFKPLFKPNEPEGDIIALLQKLIAILKKYRNKNFQKLHLRFHRCYEFNDKFAFRRLGLEIAASFRNLQEFSLEFLGCGNLTDETIRFFFEPLHKVFKALRKLKINVVACPEVMDDTPKCINSFVNKHKRLERLTLNFSDEYVDLRTGKTKPHERNIAKRLYDQSYFRYDIEYMENLMSDQVVFSVVKKIGRHLRKLKQFALVPITNFDLDEESSYDVHDRNISMIPSFKGVKVFGMFLQNSEYISRLKIKKISECIGSNLRKLEYLTLDLPMNGWRTDKDLENIATNIFPKLPLLKGLH